MHSAICTAFLIYADVELAISSCCFFRGGGGGGAVFVDAPFLGVGCTLPYVTLSLRENVESADSSCCFAFFKGVWGVFFCVWVLLELGAPCHTLPLFLMCKCWISWQCPSFLSSGEAFAALTPTSSVAPVNLGTEEILCRTSPITTETQPCWVCTFFFSFFFQHKCIPSFVCCKETVADDGACVYQVSRAVCCSSAKSKWSVLPWTDWMCIYCQFDRAGSQWMLWDLIFKMFIVEFMDTRFYACLMMIFSCVLCFYWCFAQGGRLFVFFAWRKQQTLRRRGTFVCLCFVLAVVISVCSLE